MAADSANAAHSGGMRKVIVAIAIVVVVGGGLLGYNAYKNRPNYYEPARGYLSEAAVHLSESFGDEKELLERLQRVHTNLESTIALLEKAEAVDHADQREIETLRVRLKSLEDTQRLLNMDPKELHRSYDALIGEIKALSHRMDKPAG